ncbi:hypothetical protein [Methylobacterium sp. Leaf99]|uniref:hypothetical protein n=1 Tax=Methylobacterium sp. Leaf99 TaxID=1736251 RepID=UPI0012EDF391|nr:hypothetical protein [Methylobacterium sp. Leaf99]
MTIIDPTQRTPQQSRLPDASDLGFMLGLRRQGIQTAWQHNDLLDALMGVRPAVETDQDLSKWAFLKDDGSFGQWAAPRNEHEGALFNTVREHEKALAADYAQAEGQAQEHIQSQEDLEAMATAPQ